MMIGVVETQGPPRVHDEHSFEATSLPQPSQSKAERLAGSCDEAAEEPRALGVCRHEVQAPLEVSLHRKGHQDRLCLEVGDRFSSPRVLQVPVDELGHDERGEEGRHAQC